MRILTATLLLFLASTGMAAEPRILGHFSAGSLEGWSRKLFSGETRYQLVAVDGRQLLEARARGTASALYRTLDLQLDPAPVLEWSWRVAEVDTSIDERRREGDDFAARLYVVAETGPFFWQKLALNYVWSGSEPEGSHWPSPFTERSHMIVVQSGPAPASAMVRESRNLLEDFRTYFRVDQKRISGLALMTDGDNSGAEFRAWYGDIRLSSGDATPAKPPRNED